MNRDPIDNAAAGTDWMPLDKVFQRAKQFHAKGAKKAIEDHFRNGMIRAQARELKIFESDDAFEFANDGVSPHFKSEEWRAREEAAHRWAFDLDPVPDDGSVQVYRGERAIIVYTCIGIAHERPNAFVPFRKHIQVILTPEVNRLIAHEYVVREGRRWPNSRYRSDGGYRRYEASGIRCLQTEVEAAFPYSDEYRSKKRQGPPIKFPVEEALDFLRSHYNAQSLPKKHAEVKAVLRQFYAAQNRHPSETTIRMLVKGFLEKPQ